MAEAFVAFLLTEEAQATGAVDTITREGSRLIWGLPSDLRYGVDRARKVDDLLVDTAAMRVRYLDVDLDNDLRHLAGEGTGPGTKRDNILIPIGSARLHEKDDRVTVDLLHSLVSGIPGYDRSTFNREYETDLRRHFDRGYRPDPDRDRDFYEHDLYNDSRFYGNRRARR